MLRFVLAVFLMVVPARAEMPAGHDDPRFQAARQAWLDADPDAEAQLDALAADGHEAAVILRFRLLISADPFNGRKIMAYPELEWAEAVRDSELARLLGVLTWTAPLDLEPVDVASGLLAQGEPFAAKQIYKHTRMAAALRQFSANPEAKTEAYEAMHALPAALISRAPTEVNRLALMLGLGPILDPDFMGNVWLEFCGRIASGEVDLPPGSAICTAMEAQDLDRLDQYERALILRQRKGDRGGQAMREIAAWLAEDESLPYRALCNELCPTQMTACTSFAFQKSGQLGGLDGFGSPVEALISQTDYLGSRRAVIELWATIAETYSFTKFDEARLAEFMEGDPEQCFATALEAGVDLWRQ